MGALPIGLAPKDSHDAIEQRKTDPIAAVRRYGIRALVWVLSIMIAAIVPRYAPDLAGSESVILVFVLLGTGFALEIGLAGVPDFAFPTYFAAGAYCLALMSRQTALPCWACLPVCGAFGGAIALAIASPLVRRTMPAFAIVTFAFSAVVQIVLKQWNAVTGGPAGLRFQPAADHQLYSYVLIAIVLLAGAVAWRLRRSPVATALRAAREDEVACRSIGINPAALKLTIIAIAAVMAAVAGALYAAGQGAVRPGDFDLPTTATLFALILLGGTKTQLRLVIATLLVIGGPLALPPLAEYRLLLFGVAISVWPLLRKWAPLRPYVTDDVVPVFAPVEAGAE